MQVVSLDFKPNVVAEMRKRAEEEGLKLRTWCRKVLLEALGRSDTPRAKELVDAYRQIAYQIAKIGNNLNQIARHVNQYRSLDRDWLEKLELIDRKLENLLRRLEP